MLKWFEKEGVDFNLTMDIGGLTPLQYYMYKPEATVKEIAPPETPMVRERMIALFRQMQVRSWKRYIKAGDTSNGDLSVKAQRPAPFWDPASGFVLKGLSPSFMATARRQIERTCKWYDNCMERMTLHKDCDERRDEAIAADPFLSKMAGMTKGANDVFDEMMAKLVLPPPPLPFQVAPAWSDAATAMLAQVNQVRAAQQYSRAAALCTRGINLMHTSVETTAQLPLAQRETLAALYTARSTCSTRLQRAAGPVTAAAQCDSDEEDLLSVDSDFGVPVAAPTATSAAGTDKNVFTIGDILQVHSLTSEIGKRLNSSSCRVLSPLAGSRYTVKLVDGPHAGEIKKIKVPNLQKMPQDIPSHKPTAVPAMLAAIRDCTDALLLSPRLNAARKQRARLLHALAGTFAPDDENCWRHVNCAINDVELVMQLHPHVDSDLEALRDMLFQCMLAHMRRELDHEEDTRVAMSQAKTQQEVIQIMNRSTRRSLEFWPSTSAYMLRACRDPKASIIMINREITQVRKEWIEAELVIAQSLSYEYRQRILNDGRRLGKRVVRKALERCSKQQLQFLRRCCVLHHIKKRKAGKDKQEAAVTDVPVFESLAELTTGTIECFISALVDSQSPRYVSIFSRRQWRAMDGHFQRFWSMCMRLILAPADEVHAAVMVVLNTGAQDGLRVVVEREAADGTIKTKAKKSGLRRVSRLTRTFLKPVKDIPRIVTACVGFLSGVFVLHPQLVDDNSSKAPLSHIALTAWAKMKKKVKMEVRARWQVMTAVERAGAVSQAQLMHITTARYACCNEKCSRVEATSDRYSDGTSRVSFLSCSRCRHVKYCSKACQKAHWDACHRSYCGMVDPQWRTMELPI